MNRMDNFFASSSCGYLYWDSPKAEKP